jgi:hypothetical protein
LWLVGLSTVIHLRLLSMNCWFAHTEKLGGSSVKLGAGCLDC